MCAWLVDNVPIFDLGPLVVSGYQNADWTLGAYEEGHAVPATSLPRGWIKAGGVSSTVNEIEIGITEGKLIVDVKMQTPTTLRICIFQTRLLGFTLFPTWRLVSFRWRD